MIRRRLWRDATLAEDRIRLGELPGRGPLGLGDVPRPAPRVDVVQQAGPRPAQHVRGSHEETRRALASREQIESELQALRSQLTETTGALAELQTLREQLTEATAALAELRASLPAEQARAREQGHAEGLRQGQAAAQRALEDELAHWRQTADEMLRASDARAQTLRSELTDVVMASLVKILGEQAANPHMIRAAVEQTLKESSAGAPLKVLLAPAQFEQLMKSGAAQLGWFKERRLEIAPDARVSHGGCVLETASGLIDGRLDVQLARLHEIISAHYTGSGR